jgi:hypothetical protein
MKIKLTRGGTLHLPNGTVLEGGEFRLPTGEYVNVELRIVQSVERGGLPLDEDDAADLGCRLDAWPPASGRPSA